MYQDEKYVLDMPIPNEKSDLQVVALNTESGSEELVSLLDYIEHFKRFLKFNTITVSDQLNITILRLF